MNVDMHIGLSTPHGRLGTSIIACLKKLYKETLSTPHGRLGTPLDAPRQT